LFGTRSYASLPMSRPTTRRTFVASAGVAAASMLLGVAPPSTPSAVDSTVVEDWRQRSLGARGIPPGWEPYSIPGGRPAYDFSVVTVDGRRALHLKSHGDRSTIARAVRVDLTVTPVLEWSWKTIRLPDGADVRRAATSDLSAHLLVVWPRAPRLVRSRILAYAWDTTAPANTIERSHKTPTVTFVIVRSGHADLARWFTERRDVRADYRSVYGEEPEPVQAVALSIDTNDTGAPAEAFIGAISFQPR
jgi:hypothetical protein